MPEEMHGSPTARQMAFRFRRPHQSNADHELHQAVLLKRTIDKIMASALADPEIVQSLRDYNPGPLTNFFLNHRGARLFRTIHKEYSASEREEDRSRMRSLFVRAAGHVLSAVIMHAELGRDLPSFGPSADEEIARKNHPSTKAQKTALTAFALASHLLHSSASREERAHLATLASRVVHSSCTGNYQKDKPAFREAAMGLSKEVTSKWPSLATGISQPQASDFASSSFPSNEELLGRQAMEKMPGLRKSMDRVEKLRAFPEGASKRAAASADDINVVLHDLNNSIAGLGLMDVLLDSVKVRGHG